MSRIFSKIISNLLYNLNMMSIEDQNNLGEKIRQARVIANISQDDLAKLIGIGRNSMIETEKGRRELTLTELKKIAEATNQPLSFFIKEEPEENHRAYNHDKKFRDLSDLNDEAVEAVDKLIELLRKNSASEK